MADRRRQDSDAPRLGRRATDRPNGYGWSTGQFGRAIGLSDDFILGEIKDGRIIASRFGRVYRIAPAEVRRYCEAKGYPVPDEALN